MGSRKWHDLDLVGGDDLTDEGRLVDDEAGLELFDALTAGFEAFLNGHIPFVVLVEDRVDEVGCVPVGSFGHLLKSTEVVHPVELCFLFNQVITTHKHVDLERVARPEGGGHLRAEEVGSGFNTWLETSSVLHQLQIPHHQVGKLVSIRLLARCGKHLKLVNLHDFVVVMLEGEDRSID